MVGRYVCVLGAESMPNKMALLFIVSPVFLFLFFCTLIRIFYDDFAFSNSNLPWLFHQHSFLTELSLHCLVRVPMWLWRLLRKHLKMVEESGCRWEMKERASRATAAQGQRESWCNCVTAASVSSLERWRRKRRGRERWRDESRDERRERTEKREVRVQGQADLWVSVSESWRLWGI